MRLHEALLLPTEHTLQAPLHWSRKARLLDDTNASLKWATMKTYSREKLGIEKKLHNILFFEQKLDHQMLRSPI